MLLLRPRALAFKNHLFVSLRGKSLFRREVAVPILSLLLMALIFRGTYDALIHFQHIEVFSVMPVEFPLSLMLAALCMMLFISSCSGVLGSFFLGHDLDFLLSKPLSHKTFFFGKLSEVITQSGWMLFLFAVPMFIAFAFVFEAPITFWIIAATALAPLLCIPSLLAFILISLVVQLVPANRTREIILAIAGLTILSLYFYARNSFVPNLGQAAVHDTERLLQALEVSHVPYLPSYWSARALGSAFAAGGFSHDGLEALIILLLATAVLSIISYSIFSHFYIASFSKTQSAGHSMKIGSANSQRRIRRWAGFIPSQSRALWAKEMKLFARDVTQTIQLALLLGICVIYLYNFKAVNHLDTLSAEAQEWWSGALALCNTALGAFVITAVSTRFVFSSLSLEGKSFWVLQSAPIETRKILQAKFWAWYLPMSIIASIILASGAFAIDAEPHIVMVTAVVSWVLCYGIVGMAVGLGALFATFDWDSVSQISAGVGSLLFMVAGTLLVILDTVPIGILIILRTLRTYGVSFTPFQWYSCVTTSAALLVLLNFYAASWALRLGCNAMANRE